LPREQYHQHKGEELWPLMSMGSTQYASSKYFFSLSSINQIGQEIRDILSQLWSLFWEWCQKQELLSLLGLSCYCDPYYRNDVKRFSKFNKTTEEVNFIIVAFLCNNPKSNKMIHNWMISPKCNLTLSNFTMDVRPKANLPFPNKSIQLG